MAKSTLPVPGENRFALPKAARACGMKVGIGFVATVSLLALLGTAIEHRQLLSGPLHAVWIGMLWLVALGDQLWGSIAVGTFAFVVLVWTHCLAKHLPEQSEKPARATLAITGVLAAVLWLLANFAMHTTYDNFDTLTVYEQIAVVAMHVPYVAIPWMLGYWFIAACWA